MEFKRVFKKYYVLIYILVLLAIDIITKHIFITERYFTGSYVYIRGMFSFGSIIGNVSEIPMYPTIVFYLSMLFIVVMVANREFFLRNKYLVWTYILMIVGVLGNAYDRFILGAVRNFIGIGSGYDLFVFNVADVYIVTGLVFYSLFYFLHHSSEHSKRYKKYKKDNNIVTVRDKVTKKFKKTFF